MIAEHTEKLVFKLTREELEALARVVGPGAEDRWWYREWMRRHGLRQEADVSESRRPGDRRASRSRDGGRPA